MKTVILVIASILFASYSLADDRPFTNENLQAWYAGYNETLFDSELPIDTVVVWKNLPENILGRTNTSQRPFVIMINPKYNVAGITAQETEIHEMCHVEDVYVEKDLVDSYEHGPKWQACMLRIAKAGGFATLW